MKDNVTLGMVAHVGNQSTWEVDAKGSRVWSQPQLHEILSVNKRCQYGVECGDARLIPALRDWGKRLNLKSGWAM